MLESPGETRRRKDGRRKGGGEKERRGKEEEGRVREREGEGGRKEVGEQNPLRQSN